MDNNTLRELIAILCGIGGTLVYILNMRQITWYLSAIISMMIFMILLNVGRAVMDYYFAEDWWNFSWLLLCYILMAIVPIVVNFFVDRYENKEKRDV